MSALQTTSSKTHLITSGDIHLKASNPKMRKDDIVTAQFKKLEHLVKEANKYNADVIFAGDVFDNAFTPYRIIARTIAIMNKLDGEFLAVFGQHDLRYHSLKQIDNTPLQVLLTAVDGVKLDNELPYCLGDDICVKGMSWGQEYPKPEDDKFNILVAHLTVTNSGSLFPGDNQSVDAKKLLDKLGFDLIVTGDNHQSFYVEKNGRLLVNNGSMLRLNTTQKEFKPRFSHVVIDEDYSIDFEWVHFPIEEDVFNEQEIDRNKSNEALDKYLETIKNNDYNQKVDFIRNLRQVIKGTEEEKLKFWLNEILESYIKQEVSENVG